VSEIEFRTPYAVAERWIVARMLGFMHAKNVHSDTLSVRPQNFPFPGYPGSFARRPTMASAADSAFLWVQTQCHAHPEFHFRRAFISSRFIGWGALDRMSLKVACSVTRRLDR
jgi:hypothetical protein